MIDNLEQILPLMDFSDPDKFYFIECLQRKKDIPDLDRSIRMVKTYTVSSEEALRKIYPEIQLLCDTLQARAYMYVNRRSRKAVGRSMLKSLADIIYSENYHGLNNLFASECGKHSAGDKLWIMDIDSKDLSYHDYKTCFLIAEQYRNRISHLMPDGDKFVGIVPSKSGFHILTHPFDLRSLNTITDSLVKYAYELGYSIECELKKDAMVNLYIPDMP